ncbi:MAG TPA: sigma-70 family RNA polymerase sigma factor [Thermoanaerobaculia bacterium]|jgi:DNA-directed RNA polymerase specialized sigma24 family protein|nr:sigma-70 family RNA polymerase sigma factor [Thermoanaerobaculia bacterium]
MEPWTGLCLPPSCSFKPEAAWERLVARYGPALKARVGSVLRRAGVQPRGDQVEEIVQEVYCRLLAAGGRRLRRCRATSEGQVAAFLGRVAERVALDQLRAARAQKRGGALAAAPSGAWSPWGDPPREPQERAADPGANPEELMLSRERLRLFLERCGTLAGRRDYRRNARILALAAAGMSSGEIARALGGPLTARGVDGLLPRVRRYVAAHAQAAAAGLDLAPQEPAPRGATASE